LRRDYIRKNIPQVPEGGRGRSGAHLRPETADGAGGKGGGEDKAALQN
jgi:hypothetical protein